MEIKICDECESKIDSMQGYYELSRYALFATMDEDNKDRHFCDITCLSAWANAHK